LGDDVQKPLKLTALDVEDLAVISACLQDAISRVADTAYEPKRRRFAILFNRFRWENEGKPSLGGWSGPRTPERVRCAVHFDGVTAVRHRNINQANQQQLLDLLAIQTEEQRDGTVRIQLVFAGGAEMLLEAECVDCYLEDLSQPWPATGRPEHSIEE
jgi:hypothetical protein